MTISDFLNSKQPSHEDLFGPWRSRGVHTDSNEAWPIIARQLSYIRRHLKDFLAKNPIAAAQTCKFKRDDVPGGSRGEWIVLYDAEGAALKCFTASSLGFVEMPLPGVSTSPKDSVKTAAVSSNEAIPYELRTSWTNTKLLEKLNAECEMRAVEYWNKKAPGTYEV